MAKRGRYTRENMTKDQLSALVNFVKCNAPIWDKSNKDYKNQELKDKLWSSLGVRLNKTGWLFISPATGNVRTLKMKQKKRIKSLVA